MPDHRAIVIDRVATIVVWSAVACVVGALLWMIIDLVIVGWSRLSFEFLTTAPRRSGRAGGIAPVLFSTGLIVATSLVVAKSE